MFFHCFYWIYSKAYIMPIACSLASFWFPLLKSFSERVSTVAHVWSCKEGAIFTFLLNLFFCVEQQQWFSTIRLLVRCKLLGDSVYLIENILHVLPYYLFNSLSQEYWGWISNILSNCIKSLPFTVERVVFLKFLFMPCVWATTAEMHQIILEGAFWKRYSHLDKA